MNNYESLNHTQWEGKYHIVFIPKGRRKVLYGQIRTELGEVLRELARQKESKVAEGHLRPDHVQILLSIPPKYAVAQVVGYLKGKSAIYIARTFGGKQRNFVGEHFWARGYFVSTVGREEQVIRRYIQHQEAEDKRLEQLARFRKSPPWEAPGLTVLAPSGSSEDINNNRFERFTSPNPPALPEDTYCTIRAIRASLRPSRNQTLPTASQDRRTQAARVRASKSSDSSGT
jgi:putative transposase